MTNITMLHGGGEYAVKCILYTCTLSCSSEDIIICTVFHRLRYRIVSNSQYLSSKVHVVFVDCKVFVFQKCVHFIYACAFTSACIFATSVPQPTAIKLCRRQFLLLEADTTWSSQHLWRCESTCYIEY